MLEARQYAPATERNRQPILAVLQQVLPPAGSVLEIASGTGEHATFFAPRLPHLRWIPTEREATSRASIQAWQTALPSDNLQPPLALDVSQTPWPVEANQPTATPITAIVNINMVHISPWEMCEHLMSGAERILPTGGVLCKYRWHLAMKPLIECYAIAIPSGAYASSKQSVRSLKSTASNTAKLSPCQPTISLSSFTDSEIYFRMLKLYGSARSRNEHQDAMLINIDSIRLHLNPYHRICTQPLRSRL